MKVGKKTDLKATNKNYKSDKELIEICLEESNGSDSIPLKIRREQCKKSITSISRKTSFSDTLVQVLTFFGKSKIESVSKSAISGKYFVLFPAYTQTLYDPAISATAKIKLRKFLKGIDTKNYGLLVKKEAEKGTEKEWASDLTSLLINKKSLSQNNAFKETSQYLKKGSAIFLNAGFTYLFKSKLKTNFTGTENRFTAAGSLVNSDTLSSKSNNTTLPAEIVFGISLDKPKSAGYRRQWRPDLRSGCQRRRGRYLRFGRRR